MTEPETDDGEVMRQVREGDVERLGILFERHHRRLYNYCLRLTRDRELAGDMVQEVFLRILKYRHTYRDGGPFLPWLFRLAKNAWHDHGRRATLEVEAPDEALDAPSPAPAPSEHAEKREEVRLLSEALGRLPDDRRELLVMARFGSLGYREIAEVLGIRVGTVRVRVHRALGELKQVYAQVAQEVPR